MNNEYYFQKALLRLTRSGVGSHNLYKFFMPLFVRDTVWFTLFVASNKDPNEEEKIKIQSLVEYFTNRWLEVKDSIR